MSTIKSTVPRYCGPSSDHRTNRWSVTCPGCGRGFEPPTTLKQFHSMECPGSKCRKELWADYNEPVVILAADLPAYRAQKNSQE